MSWALSAITGNPAINFLRMEGVWNAFKPAGGGTLSQEGEFSDDEFFKFHGSKKIVESYSESPEGLVDKFAEISNRTYHVHIWLHCSKLGTDILLHVS